MASFSLNIAVTKKPWMDNPKLRWDAGLQRCGQAWRTSNSPSYEPPINPSYDRTGTFGRSSDFEITEMGTTMTFGSTFYAPFILFGTRKWEGWPGHMDNSVDMMAEGFRNGVRDYE